MAYLHPTTVQHVQKALTRGGRPGAWNAPRTAPTGRGVRPSGWNPPAPTWGGKQKAQAASNAKGRAAAVAKSKSGGKPSGGGSGSVSGGSDTRTPVAPFLTPQQQHDESTYDTNYSNSRDALIRKQSDATANTNFQLTAAQHSHDVNANQENQLAAARGMFQSSIRAGDLNDIDSTLAMRQNILNTGLHSLTLGVQSDLGTLDTNYGTEHNWYDAQAVQNAQNQPPSSGSTGSTPGTGGTGTSTGKGTTTTTTTTTHGGTGQVPGGWGNPNPPGAWKAPAPPAPHTSWGVPTTGWGQGTATTPRRPQATPTRTGGPGSTW